MTKDWESQSEPRTKIEQIWYRGARWGVKIFVSESAGLAKLAEFALRHSCYLDGRQIVDRKLEEAVWRGLFLGMDRIGQGSPVVRCFSLISFRIR